MHENVLVLRREERRPRMHTLDGVDRYGVLPSDAITIGQITEPNIGIVPERMLRRFARAEARIRNCVVAVVPHSSEATRADRQGGDYEYDQYHGCRPPPPSPDNRDTESGEQNW